MRNLNGGRSRSRDSTMDPLKKPVPSGLGRPVKQQGLTQPGRFWGIQPRDATIHQARAFEIFPKMIPKKSG